MGVGGGRAEVRGCRPSRPSRQAITSACDPPDESANFPGHQFLRLQSWDYSPCACLSQGYDEKIM